MKKLIEIKKTIENNIIFKVCRITLYVIVCILLALTLVQKITNNNLSVGGYRIFMIVSESMKGEYEIGDVLVSKQVPVEEINIGDNVTYRGKESSLNGLIITHKVVEKRQNGDSYIFVTKGNANSITDPEISYDQIYGKVITKLVVLSFIAKLMTKQLTYYILFVAVALIISIEVVSAMFDIKKEKEEDERRE